VGASTLPILLLLAQAELPPAAADPAPPPLEVTGEEAGADTQVHEEITVLADEPRFVAPTRRDRIGRIWAPVLINGSGPFRLVLATGASHSALTAKILPKLGVSPDPMRKVLLRGATGSVEVPMVPVESLEIGDVLMEPKSLAVVPDALGGADGVLGTEGFDKKRVHIDFRRDSITIRRSKNESAEAGFQTIPFDLSRGRLLLAKARLGAVAVKAIIDTGGQATIGNEALRRALIESWRKDPTVTPDEVTGATLDIQDGMRIPTPALAIGDVMVRNNAMTFGDFAIFQYWKMTDEPAMLVGMDVLGLLDTLIIDYRREELQIKLRRR
jgi:Aspartyl protease